MNENIVCLYSLSARTCATYIMTRPAGGIFRLAADEGRSGVEGGGAASALFLGDRKEERK